MIDTIIKLCNACGQDVFMAIVVFLFGVFLVVVLLIIFFYLELGTHKHDVHVWGKTKYIHVRKSLIDEYRRTYNDYMPGKCGSSMTDNEIVECALSCDIRSMQEDIHGWKHEVEEIWKEASEGGE